MGLGPHAGFIIAAYGAAAAVIALLFAWIVFDYRAQRRLLARLGERGEARFSPPRRREA